MTQPPLFHSEQLAAEWATRIAERMQEINVPTSEIEETRSIIFAFTKIAADELSKERAVKLPYTDQPFEVGPEQAHQIIDLFLRGVNHSAKKLRETGKSWDDRRPILEDMAFKLFNLAKLLVGFLYIPNPAFQNLLNNQKDLQLMMKQSTDALLQETLGGQSPGFPLNMMPRRF